MVRKVVARFEVSYLQILDENGELDIALDPKLTADQVRFAHYLMVLARTLDERMFKLQRMGKIGTFAPVKGQEACQIGSVMALSKDDWMVPAFRESAAYLARGTAPYKIIQAARGDTRSVIADAPYPSLPVAIPVGSQTLHAVGIGWAMKLQQKPALALVYFGDGATSEGDVHEAFNFAGDFKIPVIFLCQNNQWAISTPRLHQTASETIAQKAIAYGISGIQVDGNDLFAVYTATKEAAERARRGEGPTLIECMTYRLADHTTSDDASKYRTPDEVKEWERKEPIRRLELYLSKIGQFSDTYKQSVQAKADQEIEVAVTKAMDVPPPDPKDLFQYIFETMHPRLQRQYEQLLEELGGKP